jgi:UDP-glucose 4-epimerase
LTTLVTGGAGYIGSQTGHARLDRGDSVVVLDDLSTGDKEHAGNAVFALGDVADAGLVTGLLAKYEVDAVIHFAGSIVVPDSVTDLLGY